MEAKAIAPTHNARLVRFIVIPTSSRLSRVLLPHRDWSTCRRVATVPRNSMDFLLYEPLKAKAMGLSIPSELAMNRSIETQLKAGRSRPYRKRGDGAAPQKKTESRTGTLLWMEGWSDG